MYKLKISGSKKSVYMVWSNLLGYDLPNIETEKGSDEEYEMICSLSTKYDGFPNQHAFALEKEVWNGTKIDLTSISIEAAKAGHYSGNYTDYEIIQLSGLFSVYIGVLCIPDDPWWIDAELDPEYPYYEYKDGNEETDTVLGVDEAIETGMVTMEELGMDEEYEDWGNDDE